MPVLEAVLVVRRLGYLKVLVAFVEREVAEESVVLEEKMTDLWMVVSWREFVVWAE